MEETSVVATEEIKPKMQFTGKVLKTSLAGALVDIGVHQPAVLHISQIPAEGEGDAIRRVEDVLQIGQDVNVWVRKVKDDHIELTMIKPLDLEWRELKKGMSVKGIVVRLEKFGAFIEIGAERPGLVHISEMAHGYVKTPNDVVKEGDEIEAEILEVNRKKKQIKLSIKALQPEPVIEEPVKTVYEKSTSNERPVRRAKKPRGKGEGAERSESTGNYVDSTSSPSEPEQTAMEIKIREAMDKAKEKKHEEAKARKAKAISKEQDDLLARTLENKVQVG
jgi:small subunit ribosomal protein S1